MIPLRKVFFWLHLTAGVSAGVVIFIMSVTGVLLTYERQILAWADRDTWSLPPEGFSRLPATALLSKAYEGGDAELPTTLTVRSDRAAPASIGLGRGRTLFLNPCTGELLGEGNQEVRSFFRVVTDWHRWLGASGESRLTGRAITGLRFLHTGEALGFAGQTVAGLVSAGAAVLVFTGLSLSWRRFFVR